MRTWIHTCTHSFVKKCLCKYVEECMQTFIHTCMHTYAPSYTHAHMHTCTQAYRHTCVNAYTQTHSAHMLTCLSARMHVYKHTCIWVQRTTSKQTHNKQNMRKYTGTDSAPNYPKVDPCTSSLNLEAKSALKFTGAFLHSGQSRLEPPKWQIRGEG